MTQVMNRRALLSTTVGLGTASILGASAEAQTSDPTVTVSRFDAAAPFPVNAYIVEGRDGVVVVDATLTNTSSKALRAMVDATGKPLRAVLLTHPHPDHYAGLGNLTDGLSVPIVSVAGVNAIAMRDDADKDQIIGGMFGAEWPKNRVMPSQIVKDGDRLDFGAGLAFEVMDIGPAESLHDSLFVLEGPHSQIFSGDIAYGLMHPYMADNKNPDWSKALQRLQSELPENSILNIGHGMPVTPGFLEWQRHYLSIFEATLKTQDWSDSIAATAAVSSQMRTYLPNDDLAFLMELSAIPNAKRLGLL